MAGRCGVMVATPAFGLGIDKADLRFVLHYQMPSGLDAYYQETGRAGRDGQQALCTLLFLRGDRAVQQFFLANRYPSEDDLSALYEALRTPCPDGAWTLELLRQKLHRPRAKLQVALNLLRRHRVAAQDRAGSLRLLRQDLDAKALAALGRAYADKRAEDQALLEQMVFYAQTGWCRWRVLLEHLGSLPPGFDRCGHCDNCVRLARHLQDHAPQQERHEPRDSARTKPGADSDRPLFAIDDEVRVRRYGRGRVTSVDATSVCVEFPNGESRCFLADWVTSIPARRARAKASKAT